MRADRRKLAQEAGLDVGTHTWSDAVALVANAHFVASLPNGLTVEVDQTGNPFIDELLAEPLAIEDGRLLLGDRPGLGIELDMDVVRRLNADYGDRMKDGNYSDLIFGRRVRVGGAAVRAVTTAIFDAHHHLWDTRVLDYASSDSCRISTGRSSSPSSSEEARDLGVTGSLWVEAASAGADGVRGARVGA